MKTTRMPSPYRSRSIRACAISGEPTGVMQPARWGRYLRTKSTAVGQADESSSPVTPPSSSLATCAETSCAPSAVSLTPAKPSCFSARINWPEVTFLNSLTHDGASEA